MRLRSPPLVLLLSAVAIACGPKAQTDATGPASGSASAPASASAPPPAPSAAAAPPPPPRPAAPRFVAATAPQVAPPATPGCVLETTGKLPYDGGLPLQVDPESSPFVRVIEGGGRLSWPAGPGTPIATIVRDAFTLSGFAPSNVKVHASRAIRFAGVLSATAGTTFTIVGAAKGNVVPTITTPVFKPRKPLEAQPCKDFGLDVPKIDPKAGLPVPKTVKQLYLRAATTAVSATATGEPVLDLSPALADKAVTVLEESGERTRFVLEHEAGNVIGWAATRDLSPDHGPPDPFGGLGDLGLIGHGAGSGHGSLSLGEYECDHDLSLYADMTVGSVEDQTRRPYARIGTVRKKQVLKIYAGHQGLDRVAGQRLEGVIFTGQGALSVASEEVRKCKRLVPKRK